MKVLFLILLLIPSRVFARMEIRTDKQGNPIIEQFSEEGFVDCVFKIKNLVETKDSYKFHLAASHGGETLGFNVSVVKCIKGGFDSKMNLVKEHVYRHGVKFYRSGEESDRLITILSVLYGNKPKKLKMVKEETFTGIALHEDPIDMTSEPIKIKIFGKDSEVDFNEDAYYESFFNLDLKNGFVFWNEKDQDYRKPLIRGLSQ